MIKSVKFIVFVGITVFSLNHVNAQKSPATLVQTETQKELTEAQKIDKLIAYVEVTEAKFVRNGTEYSGVDAAKHLRMKREKAGKKITTARQFIDYLASKSSMSGEPYLMKFKNGSTLPVRDILYHQLKKMESVPSLVD
ncbi:MAG: DUF5329 domain-containing protein [Bacteroidia bacterium]|nr:DUF5329 domain-containing protein [Bacteroidia bacterium]